MNDQELEEVAEYLASRLRDRGEDDLADQDAYIFVDEHGAKRRHGPRKRLFLMLLKLEQQMALLDRSTYDEAYASLAKNVENFASTEISIVPTAEEGFDAQPFTFKDLTDLRELRGQAISLAHRIVEEPDDGEFA